MPDLETTEAAVLSTAHMTEKDSNVLESLFHYDPWEVYTGASGFFVWTGESRYLVEKLNKGVSESLIEALNYVDREGYDWARFDADGPEIGALTTHDW